MSFSLSRMQYWLSIVLVSLLPFHAFLLTFLGKWFLGAEKDSLPFTSLLLSLWKEAIITLIFLLGIHAWRQFHWSRIDTLFVIYIVIHLIWSIKGYVDEQPLMQILMGLRTNLLFILSFWAGRVVISDTKILLTLSKIIVGSTLISFWILPLQILGNCHTLEILGYTPYESSWVADKPLPCGHTTGISDEIFRAMGTFSGPNQLASFLILIFALISYLQKSDAISKIIMWSMYSLNSIAFLGTFSRGAWLGFISSHISHRFQSLKTSKWMLFAITCILCVPIIWMSFHPERWASSSDHLTKPLASIERILQNPMGSGIGQAGPVSLRFPPDGSQGKIAENWYLQIAEEVGILGLGILLWSFLLFAQKIRHGIFGREWHLAFIGISINALFLHTWSNDSITTMIFWFFAGIYITHLFQTSQDTHAKSESYSS